MDTATKEMAAIAAAIAGKCQPCFAHHYKQAQEIGIADEDIQEVIQLAQDIRASGDKHMDGFAERRMGGEDHGHHRVRRHVHAGAGH